MKSRISSAFLACAASLLLFACPPAAQHDAGIDEDYDGSVPVGDGTCTGGCPANKVCDAVKRVCVDPCGGCASGAICQKNAMNAWQCVTPVTTCNGTLCGEGEIACVAGECGCLGPARASKDSCTPFGKVCSSGKCRNPQRYEACDPAAIANSPCPQNHSCKTIFGDEGEEDAVALCTPNCDTMAAMNTCDRGTFCHSLGCIPIGLFTSLGCAIQVPATLSDGGMGLEERAVPASNVCLMREFEQGSFTEATPSGNCSYAFFRTPETERYPIATCRQAGTATEGQRCKNDFRSAAVATQCGLGLDCFINKGDEGVCLRMCNAVPPLGGVTPQPACNTGEVCTNVFRVDDDNNNAVEGLCMKSCDVFDATKNTCAAVGTTPASCVPTGFDGHTSASPDGKGVCIPRQATVSAVGAECPFADPFLGAACGDSQLCLSTSSADKPVCVEACDYDCNASDAGVPARCSTESHARCTGGKTCSRVTAGFTRMGVCR